MLGECGAATKRRHEENLTCYARSDIHDTTKKNGVIMKDDPHITISLKNPQQAWQKKHLTAHGYTKSMNDVQIVKAEERGLKSDDVKDPETGREIWPKGLPTENVVQQVK